MFKNTADFPEFLELEKNFNWIREEILRVNALQDFFIKWRAKDIGHYNWYIIGFKFCNRSFENNIALFPKLSDTLKGFKDLPLAALSRLKGRTKINPHKGYRDNTYRGYLGIKVPQGCTLTVGKETKKVEEGKLLIFDDTITHFAENKSDEERIVLLFDFVIPGKKFGPVVPDKTADLLVRFHRREWDKLHIRKKLVQILQETCPIDAGTAGWRDHWNLHSQGFVDSLGMLELAMRIEEDILGRELSDDDIALIADMSLHDCYEWLWIDLRKRERLSVKRL